jgi:hypothetical protein
MAIVGMIMPIILSAQEEISEELHENALEQVALTDDTRLLPDITDNFIFGKYDRISINKVSHDQLASWGVLSLLQIHAFLWYRETVGAFISLMELQAIPHWDPDIIKKVLPRFKSNIEENRLPGMRQRLKEGSHIFLYRTGGKQADSSAKESGNQPHLLTYRFRFRTLMQWGITLESDAGEARIPDHISAYLKLTDLGLIRQLIAGDFTVNLGQGLIHWQGFAVGGSGMLNSFRQGDAFKPHTGRDENIFHRGLALSLAKNKWEAALFVSHHPIDANTNRDTVSGTVKISSFLISGLHRTNSELENKRSVTQTGWGGKIGFNTDNLKLAFNAVHFQFDHNIAKRDLPYNLFEQKGKSYLNMSLDGVLITQRGLLFTEWGVDKQMKTAFTAGWIRSLDNRIEISMLYRNMSAPYQAWQSGCFSQSGQAGNEKGFYFNMNFSPKPGQRFEANFDIFNHPWVKALADAPSHGKVSSMQYIWKPNKKAEWLIRWQQSVRWMNATGSNQVNGTLVKNNLTRVRVHLSFTPLESVTMRIRHELSFLKLEIQKLEKGSLSYVELIYKPAMKPFSLSVRYTLFDTEGYNSRIYAYERDVPAYHTIPAFYTAGNRIYAIINWKWKKTMLIAAKWITDIRDAGLKHEWRIQLSWQVNRDN